MIINKKTIILRNSIDICKLQKQKYKYEFINSLIRIPDVTTEKFCLYQS